MGHVKPRKMVLSICLLLPARGSAEPCSPELGKGWSMSLPSVSGLKRCWCHGDSLATGDCRYPTHLQHLHTRRPARNIKGHWVGLVTSGLVFFKELPSPPISLRSAQYNVDVMNNFPASWRAQFSPPQDEQLRWLITEMALRCSLF